MHVVFTSDFLDLDNIGGAGRVIWELARCFAADGHQISFISGAPRTELRWIDIDGHRAQSSTFEYSTRDSDPGGRGLAFFWQVRRGARSAAAALDRYPDLLIHNQPLTASFLGGYRSRSLYLFHSPWPLEYVAEHFGEDSLSRISEFGARARVQVGLRRLIEGRAVRAADGVVTLSRHMRDRVRELYHVADRCVRVCPGGADLERFRPTAVAERRALRRRWFAEFGEETDADAPLFVCLRRLIPRTGVDLLIDAFADVVATYPRARVLIAGGGHLADELDARRRRLRLERQVHLLGYVPDAALAELLQAADYAVVPTRALEGFGLSTLEALACGTPVVATPVGGTVEILEALASPRIASAVNATALASVIVAACADLSDLEAVASERRCAREYVASAYSWRRMADQVLDASCAVLTVSA